MAEPLEQKLCEYCDEYHECYVGCPHMGDFRRLTDEEEHELDQAAYARHDKRLFG